MRSTSEQNPTAFEHEMFELGKLMRDISTWTWATIFLFFLIFPPIVLLVREIQFLLKLDELASQESDPDFQHGEKMILIGTILNLIGVGVVIGWIFLLIGFKDLERYAQKHNQVTPSANFQQAADGFHMIAIGYPLCLIIVGVFMIAIGNSRAGEALMAQYGTAGAGQTIPLGNAVQAQQVTEAPSMSAPEQDPFKDIKVARFCRSCGAEISRSEQKFCSKCGSPLN